MIQTYQTEILLLYPVYENQASHPFHQQCKQSQMYLKKNSKKRTKNAQQVLFP